jgi:flagellar protein FlgJ
MIERLNGREGGLPLPRTMVPNLWLEGGSLQAVGLTRQAQSGRGSDPQEQERRRLVEAGREFEAYFISYLFKVMRETIPQGVIADREGAYLHFLSDEEIGRRAAEAGGIGLARLFETYAEQQGLVRGRSGSSFGPF